MPKISAQEPGPCGSTRRFAQRTDAVTRCLFVAALVALLTGCGGSSRRPSASKTFLFADTHAPLRVVDRPFASKQPRVRVREVSFAGRRERVNAYIAAPVRPNGRLASVVLLHGTGGTRRDFLPYAVKLAQRGFAALTVTA